jgi:hypothetical protein
MVVKKNKYKGDYMATVHEVREPVGVGPAVIAARAIYFIFGVIEAFIVLRIILLLLAANQSNGFVDFIYSVSGIFVSPFFGVFGYTPTYGASVFEISSLVALVVYGLVCWGLSYLVTLGSRERTEV